MNSEIVFTTIKSTVITYLPTALALALLFCSCAWGRTDKYSDNDLMVIIFGILTVKEKSNWSSQIQIPIVKAAHISIDLLHYNDDEIGEKQVLPGHNVHTAMREGIAI